MRISVRIPVDGPIEFTLSPDNDADMVLLRGSLDSGGGDLYDLLSRSELAEQVEQGRGIADAIAEFQWLAKGRTRGIGFLGPGIDPDAALQLISEET